VDVDFGQALAGFRECPEISRPCWNQFASVLHSLDLGQYCVFLLLRQFLVAAFVRRGSSCLRAALSGNNLRQSEIVFLFFVS